MTTPSNAPASAKLGPARSTEDEDYVRFDFNPATITISHTAKVMPSSAIGEQEKGAQLVARSPQELQAALGTTSINLRALTFEDHEPRPDLVSICGRLLEWTHFEEAKDEPKRTELPQLNFVWGSQVYLVHLNQVTVNYTRFSPGGKPLRASVDLVLHSIPKIPGPTNPSSGGLAGRRTHLLTGAENLPELATRCYGGPGRWREIAAANRFEDPLRVRPGTLVYLPSAREAGR